MKKEVVVIGAGLAGTEAAYQLAKRGIKVKLYEMRPKQTTDAHKTNDFAELVCSNSLGGDHLGNASGLMKEELRMMDSILIKIADETKVPAGQALAVDRDGFSRRATEALEKMENIEIIRDELKEIPKDTVVLIASGPLTSESLSKDIAKITENEYLYFYDAAAPIVTLESLDMEKVYFQSRYDKGEGEYINCPMNQEQYEVF
ncbi:MAG: methylenetetrahydrofolate--tRNA-(uracil(54)-C(5))-methyltransferase (FADH(2)-oxidizing) TrmFO, partial [Cetobacterium sp.]